MKTKYYLVSRPELTRLSDKIIDKAKRGYSATGHVQTFLKSKSPVEEIAEGKVLIDYESGTTDILQGSNLRPIENIFKKEHRNVPVKIYIEVKE